MEEPGPESVERLARLLEGKYRYQIWRSQPGSFGKGAVLSACDVAVIVTTGTLPCVKAAQSALAWTAERNPSARVVTVFNQVAPSQCFTAANLSKSLGLAISHEIPFLKRLGADLVAGTPLTSRSHSLHKPLAALARDIMGRLSGKGA